MCRRWESGKGICDIVDRLDVVAVELEEACTFKTGSPAGNLSTWCASLDGVNVDSVVAFR